MKLATTEDNCHSLNERLIPNSSTKLTCFKAYPEVRISKGFRLGTKSIINHPTLFNPIKTRNINELSDVYHFTFKNDKPTDRGSVLEPNSV